jgi:hypothetical protein
MLFSQQFFYLLIGLGVLFGLPAFWLFCRGMWPVMTEKSRAAASRGLLVNFLIGVPVLALGIAILTMAGKRGQVGGIIGVAVASLVAIWGLAGLAGLALHIGGRLWPGCTGDEAWRALWRGGLVVAGVLAIPFIGWYVLFAVLLAIGLGTRVRMWFLRVPQLETQPASASTSVSTPVPQPAAASPLPANAPPLPQTVA